MLGKRFAGPVLTPKGARHSSISALAYKTLHRNRTQPKLPTIETPAWNANTAVSSILYETPMPSKAPIKAHVFNCLVQNEPGVLSRVAGTLASRGFNIDSLVVCNTEVADLSRMTIVLRGQDAVIEQARRQIEDLVPVWAVLDYSNASIIKRELLLARVSILGPEYFQDLLTHHGHEFEEAVLQNDFHPNNIAASEALRHKHQYLDAVTKLAHQFGGKVLDISERNVIVELSAKPERVTSFLHLLKPFGILEVARSGMMALPRTPLETPEEDDVKKAEEVVDHSSLPPG